MADAADTIVTGNNREYSGSIYIDNKVLAAEGIADFNHYKMDKDLGVTELVPYFFI
ncbi:MAG: hypothetical protein P8Q37_05195 [Porticoccaceae bacterium]|nr:hypothetical protein [Porticoccaceae bacterium]MDG1474279.1 hypothetical protein [Porticoccaceae bacterium]